MDHNIVPVFNMGLTGQGVTVAILGDGIVDHPDLGNSYVSMPHFYNIWIHFIIQKVIIH